MSKFLTLVVSAVMLVAVATSTAGAAKFITKPDRTCVHISTTSTFQFRVVDGRYQRRTVERIVHHCATYTQETLKRHPWAWSTGPIR